jgi:predicted RND superfamily exporter protein
LDGVATFSVGRPRAIVTGALLLSLAACAGMALLQNNTDLVRFLKPHTELFRDTMFIDRHLTGANALELVLRRADGRPLTALDDVRRMKRFQVEIRELEEVVNVLGPVDLIEQIQRAEQDLAEPVLPQDVEELSLCFELLEAAEDRALIARLFTADFRAAHISVRVRAVGTARARELIERVRDLSRRALGDGYDLQLTGEFHAVTMDSNRLVAGQVKSLSLALGMVLLVMALTFRSAKLLLAAFIPNVIPVIWTGGIMGFTGIELSSGTVMIASVVLGIAVDDTIHYLARFRREQHGPLSEALRESTCKVGPALLVSTVVLAAGFWVGAFGSFRPTIHFSLLTGFAIVSALICDLLVLPACLKLVGTPAGNTIE